MSLRLIAPIARPEVGASLRRDVDGAAAQHFRRGDMVRVGDRLVGRPDPSMTGHV